MLSYLKSKANKKATYNLNMNKELYYVLLEVKSETQMSSRNLLQAMGLSSLQLQIRNLLLLLTYEIFIIAGNKGRNAQVVSKLTSSKISLQIQKARILYQI